MKTGISRTTHRPSTSGRRHTPKHSIQRHISSRPRPQPRLSRQIRAQQLPASFSSSISFTSVPSTAHFRTFSSTPSVFDNDYTPQPNIVRFSPSHANLLRQQLDKPLTSTLGKDQYDMKSITSIDPSFHPDPSVVLPRSDNLPENADSSEILAILAHEQQLELETQLHDVADEEKRSYLIYQSSINFQKRLSKLRMARRERSRALTTQCSNVLSRMKKHNVLNLLTLISLLGQLSIGSDPNIRLYRVDTVSTMHNYMLFHSSRDASHLNLVANAVVDFLHSNPHFQRLATEQNEKSTFSASNESENSKATGQLLVFSRSEIPWRMLDLGSTLLHLSYGPERKITRMESILKPTEVDLHNAFQSQGAANVKFTKCLEITPLSMLEHEDGSAIANSMTAKDEELSFKQQ